MNRSRVLAAGVVCCVAAGGAHGHAIVVNSVPAPLAHVPAGSLHIALRYNSRIDAGRSKLTIRQGEQMRRLSPDESGPPDVLAAQTDVVAGAGEIAWQVLATDGHVTRGRIPFTADAPPPKADSR